MDIEGLHGLADGRQTAQQLIDHIIAADAKSRQLLNQQLHELDILRHKGAPASLLKAEEERLAKITADLANRNQALLSLARANRWAVKITSLPAKLWDFTKKTLADLSAFVDKASDAIKDKVKSAWQWLFGQQSVSGLGDPLSVTVVVTAIVVGAAVSAAIIFALQNHQKGATQTLDSLSKTKSALQRAREAGVISDDNYQAIVREVNQALVRENAAGARQQWWRSVGGVLKFVIPLSLGAWLILDGIPRLMRVQKK